VDDETAFRDIEMGEKMVGQMISVEGLSEETVHSLTAVEDSASVTLSLDFLVASDGLIKVFFRTQRNYTAPCRSNSQLDTRAARQQHHPGCSEYPTRARYLYFSRAFTILVTVCALAKST
jgi:hypothetical protein